MSIKYFKFPLDISIFSIYLRAFEFHSLIETHSNGVVFYSSFKHFKIILAIKVIPIFILCLIGHISKMAPKEGGREESRGETEGINKEHYTCILLHSNFTILPLNSSTSLWKSKLMEVQYRNSNRVLVVNCDTVLQCSMQSMQKN